MSPESSAVGISERMSGLLAATILAILAIPVFASPAGACSCQAPGDIEAWVDESEAAFVGTLIDRRDTADFQAIYVFEVEKWVKGDAGDVIEVRSGQGGGDCGFEFWDPDMRIGAIVEEQGGELHGSLCAQIDPDVLLAAIEGPTKSATGIGHLLVAHGWESTRLSVLDETGGHVVDLSPQQEAGEGMGTQGLDSCPGGELMVQATPREVVVWDLRKLEVATTHDISSLDGAGWISDVSCRDREASSIYLLLGGDFDSSLIEVVPEPTVVLELPGSTGSIGSDYVISQSESEGDVTWVDISSGEQTPLTETPANLLRSVSVAAHPAKRMIAVLDTRFHEAAPTESTLSIMNEDGERIHMVDLPGESYSPVWLNDDLVAVKSFASEDWEVVVGVVFDLETGETTEIEGWDVEHTIADGRRLYGVRNGTILTTEITRADIETLATLPNQFAGPLVLLETAPEVASTTTVLVEKPSSTTPPLLAPELDVTDHGDPAVDGAAMRWVAGGAIVVFLGVLIWLARHDHRNEDVT